MQLKDFDSAAFLRDHWQKSPVLIRDPWHKWQNPLTPDELAGLACEEGVEARLIERIGVDWGFEAGPFEPSRLEALGTRPWTLLVQAVDHLVPAVAALIDPFRFVPNWRIDDVMVSCAGDDGGVGPHFDRYDVFLIQGAGRRRWRVGRQCDANTPLILHDELCLLAEFEAVAEYVLEPGDILYLPPGFAHDGAAIGDGCMTYSIGFRAPSRGDLIAGFADHLTGALSDDDRYGDPDLALQDNPGEINAPALARLRAMLLDAVSDEAAFARWFGSHASTPRYGEADWGPEMPVALEDVQRGLAEGTKLVRNPASRFSFIRQGAATLLFVDGQCFADVDADFAAAICAGDGVVASAATAELVAALIDQGSIAFEDEE